jgi:hypothetical protein
MKNTFAPLKVNIDRDYSPDDAEGELITLDILKDEPTLHEYQLIAEFINSTFPEDELIAYAYLMAAAPALLEALEDLLAMAKGYIPDPRKQKYDPSNENEEEWAIGMTYQQAEQALATAKGGE